MLSIKELFELRKQIKNKKPNFVRQDSHKKKRLGKGWRRPRGLHSKVRLNLRGRRKNVSMGYRSPKKARYMHKSGLWQCLVRSVKDLEVLDAKKSRIIISSSLGNRKRIVILKKAKGLGFNVVNIKNPDEYIKKVEDDMISRKNAKEEKKKNKTTAEKKKDKLTEKVELEGDKKKIEKKEKDKLLTKKEI